MVRVSEGSSHSQARVAEAAHSHPAPMEAALGAGNSGLAQERCTGVSAASTRESWELGPSGSSAKHPTESMRSLRNWRCAGGPGGCRLHYSRAALHSRAHTSHVAASLSPHSWPLDASSRHLAHTPPTTGEHLSRPPGVGGCSPSTW